MLIWEKPGKSYIQEFYLIALKMLVVPGNIWNEWLALGVSTEDRCEEVITFKYGWACFLLSLFCTEALFALIPSKSPLELLSLQAKNGQEKVIKMKPTLSPQTRYLMDSEPRKHAGPSIPFPTPHFILNRNLADSNSGGMFWGFMVSWFIILKKVFSLFDALDVYSLWVIHTRVRGLR